MRRQMKHTNSWDRKKAIVWTIISFFTLLYASYFFCSIRNITRADEAAQYTRNTIHYAAIVAALLLVVITFLLFAGSKTREEEILKNQHNNPFVKESPVYPYLTAEAIPSSHENQTNPYPLFSRPATGCGPDTTQHETEKQEEHKMIRAVIEAIEKERRSIGQELHDHINQILATSLLTLDMVRDPDQGHEYLRLTKMHIHNAINEIRKLSHKMAPAMLDDHTLKQLFEDLLQSVNPNGALQITFDFDEKVSSHTSEDIQVNLYRILQEQLKNILKYAQPQQIEVSLHVKGEKVRMRTYDNGKGFVPSAVKSGIGLSNMRKRAESFGGKINIHSAPGKGCEIIVEIPCSNKA